mgnify:FL=1
MQIRPDEWKHLFALRDDLDGEDRNLLRKLIKYAEWLESEMRAIKALAHRAVSGGTDGLSQ